MTIEILAYLKIIGKEGIYILQRKKKETDSKREESENITRRDGEIENDGKRCTERER